VVQDFFHQQYVKKCSGNPPQNLFRKGFAPKNNNGEVCPETFTMATDPKANAVREKNRFKENKANT